jgi:hypothetical protein
MYLSVGFQSWKRPFAPGRPNQGHRRPTPDIVFREAEEPLATAWLDTTAVASSALSEPSGTVASMMLRDLLDTDPESRASWSTGIGALDDALGGGFSRGRLWVVTGAPSSGKSTLLTQFAYELGVLHGWTVDYFSSSADHPDLTRARFLSRAVRRTAAPGSLAVVPRDGDERAAAEVEALRSARISVSTGGGFWVESLGSAEGQNRCLIVDDPEGKHPPVLDSRARHALRGAANAGDIVIVSVPRSLCLEHVPPPHPSEAPKVAMRAERLREEWAAVADLVVEVSAAPLGSGYLTVWQNRWGPLAGVDVSYEPHRCRFVG